MNPATNELIRVDDTGYFPGGFVPVPAEMATAANSVLKGQDSATVAKHSGGKLSKRAAAQRKAHRSMQKASRRRNRAG